MSFNDVFSLIGIFLGLLVSLAGSYELLRRQRELRPGIQQQTTEQRVKRLTRALAESVKLIGQIEAEIKSKNVLATKLKQDVEVYDNLRTLKQSEVEAVVQALNGVVRTEGRRSFWLGAAMNFGFFLAGVVVTVIAAKVGH